MAHTFVRNHLHVVFSTKDRLKVIPKETQPELWSYMAGICRNHDIASIAIGGSDDHAHALIHLPARIALSKVVLLLKANSSRWMREHGRKFAWQEGYGAFSVSESNTANVVKYIQNQEAHHRKMSFEDEYRTLLKKHGIAYDPNYIFG